jgi:hypothetical protein
MKMWWRGDSNEDVVQFVCATFHEYIIIISENLNRNNFYYQILEQPLSCPLENFGLEGWLFFTDKFIYFKIFVRIC